jgi:excinuclease UvrABC nuclease subunit
MKYIELLEQQDKERAMTQYVVVVHNLSQDNTEYYGPYPDAEYMEMYKEINKYFKNEPDNYNCYMVQLATFTLGIENSRVEE